MFAENLAAFENTDELADEAFYDDRKSIYGIFKSEYVETGLGEVGQSSVGPFFDCWAVRVDDPPTGKTLEVGDTVYVIVRGEPHSSGRMRLILRRQA